jgi:hypothetical protein
MSQGNAARDRTRSEKERWGKLIRQANIRLE